MEHIHDPENGMDPLPTPTVHQIRAQFVVILLDENRGHESGRFAMAEPDLEVNKIPQQRCPSWPGRRRLGPAWRAAGQAGWCAVSAAAAATVVFDSSVLCLCYTLCHTGLNMSFD